MSPAVWILIVFVAIFLGTPAAVFLMNAEPEPQDRDQLSNKNPDEETENNDTEEDSTASTEPEREPAPATDEHESSDESSDSDDSGTSDDSETSREQPPDNERTATDSWSYARKYETPVYLGEPLELAELHSSSFDPDRQEDYNDRNDPDPSSRRIQAAVDWLVDANTEAIHQQSKLNEFMDNLRAFVDEPRAAGAEAIAETPWRDHSPNLSRLIGERLLVMALGLSAQGPCEMDAHRTAFRELLGETWNDDGLDHPLVYQGIGRMGLFTETPFVDLKHQLVERIPGRTPRSDDPDRLEVARYHSLLLAVSPEEGYPFPQSDRGLSRLWHWDEHNPPLADCLLLPTILYSLWVHHAPRETESDAANDFGALLGNWWDENEPETELFRAKPGVWEALLLTAWILLPDHRLIWNQIEDRYEEMEVEPGEPLEEMTERVLDWVDTYKETGERPEDTPDETNLPPADWINPLPSELVNDYSQPSFDFPEEWCENMSQLQIQREETSR